MARMKSMRRIPGLVAVAIFLLISDGYAQAISLPAPDATAVEPYGPDGLSDGIAKAGKGDPAANYRLGYMYYKGLGVPQDARKAAHYFSKAAEAGDANGQAALGHLYKEGTGVVLDISRAIDMFNRAAKQKHPLAYYELGLAYEEGQSQSSKGLFKSYDKAIRYFNAAGDGGVPQGYLKVAEYYQNGIGVERSLEKAIAYYSKVGDNEDPAFKQQYRELLSQLYLKLAAESPKPEDQYKWNLKAAETGDVGAQLFVAKALLNGRGVEPDEDQARVWFEKVAATDNLDALVNLGYIYANGVGVEIDYKKAADLYLKAAQQGSPEAAWNLGNFYANGYGVPQDSAKSQEWFRRSQALGKRQ